MSLSSHSTGATVVIRTTPGAFISLGRIVSEGNDERLAQLEKHVEAGKYDEYAAVVMQDQTIDKLIQSKSSRAVESLVLVLASAILRGTHAEKQMQELVAQILVQGDGQKSATLKTRLKVAHSLLSMIPAKEMPDLHIAVLRSLATFAAQHDKSFLHEHFHSNNIDSLLARWGHGVSALALLADTTGDVGLYDKYINTFSDSNASEADEEAVARGLISAIGDAKYFQFDALQAAPVVQKRIKSSETHAKLFELLNIFVSGTYDDFVKFASESEAFIKSSGLDTDVITKKIRLLTLLTLFAPAAVSREPVAYANVASALQIEETEVERYVIDAVARGLCQVKMNQLNKTISVTMATHRQFTPSQWQQIGEQMDLWKSSIGGLLEKLEENREKQSQRQQQQQRASSRTAAVRR